MPTLILLRHGQSEWNLANLFTGWVDVELTPKGEAEAVRGGELLAEHDVLPTVLHTSLQKRAIRTAELGLAACDRSWIPVRRSWRLNERHYGDLQGKDKKQTTEEFGADQVKIWRRSFDVPPPRLEWDVSADPRYAAIPPDVIPKSECLADVINRMLPYWYDGIVPDLVAGHVVLVAAHGNSLRGLAMHLEGMTPDEVLELNIPTGQPRVYELDDHMRVQSWRYLDPEAAAVAAEAVSKQAG
ncbi:MAG: 2,3-diphosphoglycerate-dependent phosphoglycerate mutase [Acidimicrobiia bacterium]